MLIVPQDLSAMFAFNIVFFHLQTLPGCNKTVQNFYHGISRNLSTTPLNTCHEPKQRLLKHWGFQNFPSKTNTYFKNDKLSYRLEDRQSKSLLPASKNMLELNKKKLNKNGLFSQLQDLNSLVIETILVTLMIQESEIPKFLQKYGEVYKRGCVWILSSIWYVVM